MNFWNDPLKPYEANRIDAREYVSKEHYDRNMKKFQEAIKLTMASGQMAHMITAKAVFYIFTEDELKALLKDH